MYQVPTIALVCAKLHNYCVDNYLKKKRASSRSTGTETDDYEDVPIAKHGCSRRMWKSNDHSVGLDDISEPPFLASLKKFKERYDNVFQCTFCKHRQERYNAKETMRVQFMEHLYECGLRYNMTTDKVYKI